MNALEKIASTDIKTKVNMEVATLKSLLPKDTKNFYRYQGSLSPPGCNEIVVWTVFKVRIYIYIMAVPVVEFSRKGYKIRNVFG